jgi:LacI family sucrose operon transcriptional repressor
MSRPDTIREIAQAAGVSPTTVSMVLNGKAERYRISLKTQERVRAVVEAAEYMPNQHARSLRTNKTGTLGLVLPDLSTHHFASIAKAAESQARQAGYQLLIVDSDNQGEQEGELVEHLLWRGVDGLIVAPTRQRWVHDAQAPVVFLDRSTNARQSMVVTDNETSTWRLTSELLARGLIDQRCCYIGGDPGISTAAERWAGFSRACHEAGLDPTRLGHHHGRFTRAWAGIALDGIHADGFSGGAVFLGAQMLIEGALAWWQERGGVPAGVTLCGFDDHPFFDYLPVPISTVAQDAAGLAQTAVDLLIRSIDQPDLRSERHLLPGLLRIRH